MNNCKTMREQDMKSHNNNNRTQIMDNIRDFESNNTKHKQDRIM